MKRRIVVVGVLALITSFFSFCSKTEMESPTAQQHVEEPARVTKSGGYPVRAIIDNPANPHNAEGPLHNAAMDYIGYNHPNIAQATVEERYTLLHEFEASLVSDPSALPSVADMVQIRGEGTIELGDLSGWAEDQWNQGLITTKVKDFLIDVETTMQGANGNPGGTSVGDRLVTLYSLENGVINDPTISAADRSDILFGIVIAKYSLQYWEAAVLSNNHPWNPLFAASGGGANPIVKGIKRALRDIGGFAKGTVKSYHGCYPCPGAYARHQSG